MLSCRHACHRSSTWWGPCGFWAPGNGSPISRRCSEDSRRARLPFADCLGLSVQFPRHDVGNMRNLISLAEKGRCNWKHSSQIIADCYRRETDAQRPMVLSPFFRTYRVFFLTGPPIPKFQYQKENRHLANHSCCSSKSC